MSQNVDLFAVATGAPVEAVAMATEAADEEVDNKQDKFTINGVYPQHMVDVNNDFTSETSDSAAIHNAAVASVNEIRQRRLPNKKTINKSNSYNITENDQIQFDNYANNSCRFSKQNLLSSGNIGSMPEGQHQTTKADADDGSIKPLSDKKDPKADNIQKSSKLSTGEPLPVRPPLSKRIKSKTSPLDIVARFATSWPFILSMVLLILMFVGVPLFICGFLWGSMLTYLLSTRFWQYLFPSDDDDDPRISLQNMHNFAIDSTEEKDLLPEEESCGAEGIVYKGWMNELEAEYDPHNFHIGTTKCVFVRLEKSTLRILRPKTKIPRHAVWDEKKYDTCFMGQKVYNITGAEVVLKPKYLAPRRWWVRKYPICIILRSAQQNRGHLNKCASDSQLEELQDDINEYHSLTNSRSNSLSCKISRNARNPEKSSRTENVIYLFARAHREKEFWFQRLRTAACFYSSQHPELDRIGTDVENERLETPENNNNNNIGNEVKNQQQATTESVPPKPTPMNILLEQVEVMVHRDDTVNFNADQQGGFAPEIQPKKKLPFQPINSKLILIKAPEIHKHQESSNQLDDDSNNNNNNQAGLQMEKNSEIFGASFADEFLLYAGVQHQFSRYMTNILQSSLTVGQSNLLLPKGSVCCCDLGSIFWKADARTSLPSTNANTDISVLWVNSLVARMFWDFTRDLQSIQKIKQRAQHKLDAIKLPYFIETLTLSQIEPGFTTPKITWIGCPVLNEWGLWIDMKVEYSGGMKLDLETKLDLVKLKEEAHKNHVPSSSYADEDVPLSLESSESSADDETGPIAKMLDKEVSQGSGSPPKESTGKKIIKFVDKVAHSKYFQYFTDNKYVNKLMQDISDTRLILMVDIKHFEGVLTVNIPSPPTDRLWYGFRAKPSLKLSAFPKIGVKTVNVDPITEWIEKRLKKEFEKNLVLPSMDDFIIPFMRNSPLLSAYNL